MTTDLSQLEGTIDPKTGSVPKRRFIDPKDPANGDWLHTRVKKFTMCGDVKDRERSEAEAMLRFTSPYSNEDLKALGMEHMPNSTLGELPRRVAEEEGKWTDYVVSMNGLWQVQTPNLPGEMIDEVQEKASEILNELWMDEAKHVIALQVAFRQFATFGIGPLVWTDCYDPSPIARTASSLKFPAGTRITLDNFTECTLDDSCTPQELYGSISHDPERLKSKAHGWSRIEVMGVLKHHAAGGGGFAPDRFNSLELLELQERQGTNIWESYPKNEIPTLHVFVREFEENGDGNVVSHLLMAQGEKGWRIIRQKPFMYARPDQCMVLATDRVGSDGTVAGLRGSGIDLLEHCRSMDIVHCASMYATFRSSVPIYTSTGGNSANQAEQLMLRPNGVVLQQGITEIASHVDYEAGSHMVDKLSNQADRHQRIYDINAPNKRGVQRTAKEAMFDAAKEADARSNQILPIVRLFFEPLGREFARRLFFFPKDDTGRVLRYRGWQLAEKFWIRMAEARLHPKMFQRARIVINPNNTPGGLDKKLMRVDAAMQFYPLLQTAKQRNRIVNYGLTAIFGYRGAEPILNQDEPEAPMPISEQIDSENADMMSGQQRRVFPEQDHLRHLGPIAAEGIGHCAFALQKISEIQEGQMDPITVDPLDVQASRIRAGVAIHGHMQAHLVMMGQNQLLMDLPEIQQYFDFNAELEQILQTSIKDFASKIAERQDAGESVDPKVAMELAKAQASIQAMQMKTKAEIEAAQQKGLVKLGLQQQTAEARRDEKRASFILDQMLAKKKEERDILQENAKTIIDLGREQLKMKMAEKAAAAKPKAA